MVRRKFPSLARIRSAPSRSLPNRKSRIRGTAVCSCTLFFFQAEDGIRYLIVTGVQTCALPIWGGGGVVAVSASGGDSEGLAGVGRGDSQWAQAGGGVVRGVGRCAAVSAPVDVAIRCSGV